MGPDLSFAFVSPALSTLSGTAKRVESNSSSAPSHIPFHPLSFSLLMLYKHVDLLQPWVQHHIVRCGLWLPEEQLGGYGAATWKWGRLSPVRRETSPERNRIEEGARLFPVHLYIIPIYSCSPSREILFSKYMNWLYICVV